MKKNAIISLADSNYFPLLEELINSIKSFKESNDIAICILDAGLTKEQKEKLFKNVDEIKLAKWDIEVPENKIKEENGSKVKFRELFFLIIFQVMTNIYGSIVMHGSMIGRP